MALTLNGSTNTIAGVAVGGLPDGIVDTDMLAAKAVIGSKLGSKAIINISPLAHESSDTGVTVNNTTSDVGSLCSITRKSATSNFIILMIFHIQRDTTSGWSRMQYRRQVNSDTQTGDIQETKLTDDNSHNWASYIAVDTTTGSVGDVVKIQPRGENSAAVNNSFRYFKTIIFEFEP